MPPPDAQACHIVTPPPNHYTPCFSPWPLCLFMDGYIHSVVVSKPLGPIWPLKSGPHLPLPTPSWRGVGRKLARSQRDHGLLFRPPSLAQESSRSHAILQIIVKTTAQGAAARDWPSGGLQARGALGVVWEGIQANQDGTPFRHLQWAKVPPMVFLGSQRRWNSF